MRIRDNATDAGWSTFGTLFAMSLATAAMLVGDFWYAISSLGRSTPSTHKD